MKSDITIKHAANDTEKVELATIAIKHKLYHPGWTLLSDLQDVVDGYSGKIVDICVAFDKDKPVGVSLYYLTEVDRRNLLVQFNPGVVHCFVVPLYRRQGIGTNLLKTFEVPLNEMTTYFGEVGSNVFYETIGTNYLGVFTYE